MDGKIVCPGTMAYGLAGAITWQKGAGNARFPMPEGDKSLNTPCS
jgi:hypothetical protein